MQQPTDAMETSDDIWASGQTSPGWQHVPRQQNPSPQSFSVRHSQISNSASKQYGISESQQIVPHCSPSGQGGGGVVDVVVLVVVVVVVVPVVVVGA